MDDIETQITGKTIEDNLLDNNGTPSHVGALNNDVKNNDNYEKLKKEEVKINWLRHEGTEQFLNKLDEVRQNKIREAEDAAKQGQSEKALRLILQAASIRETIEIIVE